MTNVNKNQLSGVVKTFVKSWEKFLQLDADNFVYSKCEFVDKLSDAFSLHGGNYTTSIDMQEGCMTIYDMSMDRIFKFAIKVTSDGSGYALEWDRLYTGSRGA